MKGNMFDNLKKVVSNTLTDDIKMININELHESADNFFVVENIEQFAQTILGQGGVKDNLIVRPLETGGYEIISGHRRKAAVQYLIDKGEDIAHVLPCLVQNYADEDEKMLNLILMNVSARQLSDQELWKSYETINKILKDKKEKGEYFGRIRDDIAETLGVSSAQVGKMQNVEKYAIKSVKDAVANGNVSISTANEIAKLDKKEQKKIKDLNKVQPKNIKKKVVDTNINEKSPESHKDVFSTNAHEEKEIQDKLRNTSSSNTDNYNTNAMKGYLMLAAEEASFSIEQINALLGGMMKALKNYSKAEAENKYLFK